MELTEEDKEEIKVGIKKFLEIKKEWGNKAIFRLISEFFANG